MRGDRRETTDMLAAAVFGCEAFSEQQRDYWRSPTQEEEGGIRYLIHTLGTSTYVGLAWKSDALEAAGAKTASLHPLRFMHYVFSDPSLKKDMKSIAGIPWKRFAKDFGASFAREARKGNLNAEMLQDFEQSIGVDADFFGRYANEQAWESMVHDLKDKVL